METKLTFIQCWRIVSFLLLFAIPLSSQPFVDPFQVRYMYGFKYNNARANSFIHYWAGSDLPIRLQENTYLLLSPTYEQWQIDSNDRKEIFPIVHSFSFPVGLILPAHHPRWSFTALAVPRWNGEALFKQNTFQLGGAALVMYTPRTHQKFRLGIYANAEFFGLFLIPLLGTDWRIDNKNYVFGNLPGRLTYEHQWSKKMYGGATFRSITNSYRLINKQFIRLEDNQFSLYLDYYPAKHICLTLEPGYGIFRKIRTGYHNRNYIDEIEWGDGLFFKLSLSYRIRL